MSDLDKTTYLPSEMAEEIRGVRDVLFEKYNAAGSNFSSRYLGNDVKFYDYDGTLLYSYSQNEFLDLSEMPPNPLHAGLVAQGWNWSLEDAKEYVSVYQELLIGQTYTTADRATHFRIVLEDAFLSPHLFFMLRSSISGTYGSVQIDWGDGQIDTVTVFFRSDSNEEQVNIEHVYASAGEYIIRLQTFEDTISIVFYSTLYDRLFISDPDNRKDLNLSYRFSVKEINFGNNVILSYGNLCWLLSLRSISLPQEISIPKFIPLSGYASVFSSSYELTCIVLPSSIHKLTCGFCRAFMKLSILSIPRNVTEIEDFVEYLPSLEKVCLPDKLRIFKESFYNCPSMSRLVIPRSVTQMESSAGLSGHGCYDGVTFLKFMSNQPPKIINNELYPGSGVKKDWSQKRFSTISVPKGSLNSYLRLAKHTQSAQSTYVEPDYPDAVYYNYCEHDSQIVFSSIDNHSGYPYFGPHAIVFHGTGVTVKDSYVFFTGSDVGTRIFHGNYADYLYISFTERENNSTNHYPMLSGSSANT